MTATRGCNAEGTETLASLPPTGLKGDSECEDTGEGGTIVDAGDGDLSSPAPLPVEKAGGGVVRLDSG